MGHNHGVHDTDTHFTINPITRQIRNNTSRKTVLIQGDHNSERFTFEVDRHIEEHDMSLCNRVEVHYLNVSSNGQDTHKDMYTVDDLHTEDDKVVCSWLISSSATRLVGSLTFLLKFLCVEGDVVTYAWNTAIHKDIHISDGIDAGGSLETEYPDIIAQWQSTVIRDITKDVNAGVSEWAEQESGKLRGMLYTETAKTNTAIAVERARIDQMQSGATADDAELLDIRVGVNGVTYDSAGTAVREQVGTILDQVDTFRSHIHRQSVNRFNAMEQTEDTIDPHYYTATGVPSDNASLNDSYHYTAPIPVKANTQYVVGYVPPINIGNEEVTVPWHNAAVGCFFYDKDGNILGRSQDAAFHTTANTAYIRFNYLRSIRYELDLPRIKEVCMIVEGDTLPSTFSGYYNYFVDEVVGHPPIYYDIENDVLTVVSKYTSSKDIVTTLQKKGGNDIFDFYKFGTINNETDIPSTDISNMTQFMGIGTDCHAPFNVSALSNIDGDVFESSVYTGGNHAYDGIVTGRTSSVRFFVDGREKKTGHGYAHKVKVIWENLIQAWNTVKQDGNGREVIKERHTMIFDGAEWNETIELTPTEDVKINVWYGLQMYGLSTVYDSVRYIGGVNRGTNDASIQSNSGDNVASKVIGYGKDHSFEMEIDPYFDLGKRNLYSGTTGIFVSNMKCYFYIIRNQEMKANSLYSLKGTYRFLPV